MYAKKPDGTTVAANTYSAGVNQIKIERFTGGTKDKVTSLWTYYIKVKSVNGNWSSPYSSEVEHKQLAAEAPAGPDNVKVNGKYRQLDVSWKAMEDTEYYSLGYRQKGTNSEYTEIHNIYSNSYSITGLADNTEYEIYVYGWNSDDNGNPRSGPHSLPAIGKTIVTVPEFSKYKMLNWPTEKSESAPLGSTHIKEITGSMYYQGFNSNECPNFVWSDIVDGDYTTFWHSKQTNWWVGPKVTFDDFYNIKEFIMTSRLEAGYNVYPDSEYHVFIWDENGNRVEVTRQIKPTRITTASGGTVRFTFNQPIKTNRIEIAIQRYMAAVMTISEINFFEYDSLEDDVYGLYTDEMHVTLRDDVTEKEIQELEARTDIIDEISGEQHPKKALLLSELANARKILNDGDVGGTVDVKSDVTLEGTGNLGFNGGLSGFQPLGYVAGSGDKINIYVGQKGKNIGDDVPVRLVFTQYHAESSAWKSGEIALKQGLNEVTVPEVSNLDFEKGGSLYLVHTNSNDIKNNPIKVRISGAVKIPVLDLHRTIGDSRRSEEGWEAKIAAYVQELQDYVEKLENSHNDHFDKTEKAYDAKNCYLNATEISLDNVLISVSADQFLQGLKNSNASDLEKAAHDNAVAMNQMVELFYKQRGLSPAAANGRHGTPTARFNIRYQRMFAGAFMYAGGNHLGIEYAQVPLVASGKGVEVDENGKPISGNMFGWGIAHEMGHNADVTKMTIAEVTNNIWSQFEKTRDTADTSRIPYSEVYQHVTSGTTGKPANVFAQLGMYWQLHLAYDQNYSHYDYYQTGYNQENYAIMWNNEFFARYYIMRRDWSLAPKPGGIAISEGTVDQNIMRTAIAAAGKDLTDFFKAWGYTVDATTQNYANQFPKEERKIQYLNDAAHEYTLANGAPMTSTDVDVELIQGTGTKAREVTLKLSLPNEQNKNAVLGYEIIRNGKAVAFVEPDKENEITEYTDIVSSLNNRVMTYQVIAYDKYLNATTVKELEPIKIRHDGELPTDNWTVSTNATSTAGVLTVYDGTKVEDGKKYTDVTTNAEVTYTTIMDVKYLDKDTGEVLKTESAANLVLDDSLDTTFNGKTTDNSKAWLTINLNSPQDIVGFKYRTGNTRIWAFGLQYSTNGGASYTQLGAFDFPYAKEVGPDGYAYAYFKKANNNNNIYGLKNVTNIRLALQDPNCSITEIKLLAQSGDNVDIGISHIDEQTGKEVWDVENTIGILDQDYQLDADNKIPAGSFIVTGQYTGHAAYNVVKLYNENYIMHDDSTANNLNSIISGYQVFFAERPAAGETIANTRNGTWIYWLEPLNGENEGKYGLPGANSDGSDIIVELPTKLYAQLYRVDNALTLAGERLVSDSFVVDVPSILPRITLTNTSRMVKAALPEAIIKENDED